MTINRDEFDTPDPTEGYPKESNRNTDAVDVRAVFLQNDTSNDTAVEISRDSSNNMTLTDSVSGSTTLLVLASKIALTDFMLDNEPTQETGAIDATYTASYTGSTVTLESWSRNDTTLIKTIAYTYSGGQVATEVRTVYATDGTTVLGTATYTYSYTGSTLTSSTMTR